MDEKIPLARRQHAIEAEHSAPEGNGSSRSVRLGVPRRRDKRGRRRTVARAIPRSLSLTKYTINEGRRSSPSKPSHDLRLRRRDVDIGGEPRRAGIASVQPGATGIRTIEL